MWSVGVTLQVVSLRPDSSLLRLARALGPPRCWHSAVPGWRTAGTWMALQYMSLLRRDMRTACVEDGSPQGECPCTSLLISLARRALGAPARRFSRGRDAPARRRRQAQVGGWRQSGRDTRRGEQGGQPGYVAAVHGNHGMHTHPYEDGNGRMGRLLANSVFSPWCPVPVYIVPMMGSSSSATHWHAAYLDAIVQCRAAMSGPESLPRPEALAQPLLAACQSQTVAVTQLVPLLTVAQRAAPEGEGSVAPGPCKPVQHSAAACTMHSMLQEAHMRRVCSQGTAQGLEEYARTTGRQRLGRSPIKMDSGKAGMKYYGPR